MEIGKALAGALSGFQSEVPDIKKDSSNPYFKSKYAALDSILPAIRPVLKKYGLAVVQIPEGNDSLRTIIVHSDSGESIEGVLIMPSKDATPQGHGSAITYARRYALVSMLGLNTEEDDDGNITSGRTDKPSAYPQPKRTSDTAKPVPAMFVSVARLDRFNLLAKMGKKTTEQVTAYLASLGVTDRAKIPVALYDQMCLWANGTVNGTLNKTTPPTAHKTDVDGDEDPFLNEEPPQ
jgi:hypothetical protein